jgi:quercetin dioxygenase-like cupin family protein
MIIIRYDHDFAPVFTYLNHLLLFINNYMENISKKDQEEGQESSLLTFDLQSLIEKLKQEDGWKKGERKTIPLLKNSSMRIILMALPAGTDIKLHQAEGQITVHIIEGVLKFNTENESVTLYQGQLLTLREHIKHSLNAIKDTSFLLTMAIK